MPDPILAASGIEFSYGKVPVLRQVDLTLSPGEIVSILGPNGSGKSTLLKILLGHLRGKGRIAWQGRMIQKWNAGELAKLVAYLPQTPLVDENQIVSETLALGRAPYWGAFGIESASDGQAVEAVIEQLHIDRTLLRRRLDQLSGGQRQRIFVARCLAQQPQVLLLDEPANNLDLRYQLELLALLRDLARQHNISVLMTAHDANLAAEYSDRLVLLHEGKKIADAAPAEVLPGELLAQVYGVKMEVIPRATGVPFVFPSLS